MTTGRLSVETLALLRTAKRNRATWADIAGFTGVSVNTLRKVVKGEGVSLHVLFRVEEAVDKDKFRLLCNEDTVVTGLKGDAFKALWKHLGRARRAGRIVHLDICNLATSIFNDFVSEGIPVSLFMPGHCDEKRKALASVLCADKFGNHVFLLSLYPGLSYTLHRNARPNMVLLANGWFSPDTLRAARVLWRKHRDAMGPKHRSWNEVSTLGIVKYTGKNVIKTHGNR
jgi:transcriptional regulator with XRE-family HTH domain